MPRRAALYCSPAEHADIPHDLVRKGGTLDIIEDSRSPGDPTGMTLAISDTPRTRRAYDHRLREHVVRCGAKSIAKHVQIPRSTVSTWRRRGLRPVVTTEPFDQGHERALAASARWEKQARLLAAVVRLLLALLRASGSVIVSVRPGKAGPKGVNHAMNS
jgi:hypothetical protein